MSSVTCVDSPAFIWIPIVLLLWVGAATRFQAARVTAPMAMLIAGGLVGPRLLGLTEASLGLLRMVVELTLALLLFTAGGRLHLRPAGLRGHPAVRLTFLAAPLMVAGGVLVARALWPTLHVADLVLLAVLCTPTDPELASPFFDHPRVPRWMKDLLTAESGFTDGLALTFGALALTMRNAPAVELDATWLLFALREVGGAILVGGGVGAVGAFILGHLARRGAQRHLAMGAVALAVLAWALAGAVGASGVTAAFCAGVVVPRLASVTAEPLREVYDTEGRLLLLVSFVLCGAVVVRPALAHLDVSTVLWTALSLTVLRMLPVTLALAGLGLSLRSRLVLGWMGPRGLPTVLLALLWRDTGTSMPPPLLGAVSLVLVSSALLHGATSTGVARRVESRRGR